VRAVSYSPALKWCVPLLIILLGLTLGWKLALHGRVSQTTDPLAEVSEFLIRQHLAVARATTPDQDPALQASAGLCQILIVSSPPYGSDTRLIHYGAPGDAKFVVFRGKIYARQPIWLTTLTSYWIKIQHELGLQPSPDPILSVFASRSCGAEKLPWHELK
jgi:hypothetical protein